MKQKIKEALQQEYKNLGLNDEAFERVAAFGETLGINEETLANFVKGANDTLKKMQSDADKVRNADANSKKQVEELKAKLAEAEAKLATEKPKEETTPDFAKLIAEAVTAAVQPLQSELANIKHTRSAEDAFNLAKTNFFGNDYAKKYTDERDQAWERAVEINDLTGKKMTAEELQTKAMGYFNNLVSKKGVDTSKPFESEGKADALDFDEDKAILIKEGLLKG
jgi:nitrogen fixation/metabolism regulation signal transduction histidine kinase